MKMKWALLSGIICAPGSYLYKDVCVVDIQPEVAVAVQPSDEKPPSDKMPSYQREGIVVLDEKNTAEDDRKADLEKLQADAEGKKNAGIKP